MAGVKFAGAGTMQKGSYIVVEGVACRVTDNQVSRPGKHGHAKCRITAVGLMDEKKRVMVAPGHDNVEVPIIEKKNAQVLSVNGDMANVMDAETYEQFDIAIPEELKGQVVEGAQVLYWEILKDKVLKQVRGGD